MVTVQKRTDPAKFTVSTVFAPPSGDNNEISSASTALNPSSVAPLGLFGRAVGVATIAAGVAGAASILFYLT